MPIKEFPPNPEGPIGGWYQKLNERIREAAACSTAEELLNLLGQPDRTEPAGDVHSPSKFLESIGSIFRFEDESAEIVLTYVDPYRQRLRYKFGVTGNKVTSYWKETVATDNGPDT